MEKLKQFIAVVPAAGVGKRMKANCPKQYLCINNKAILTHTVMKLLDHERISKVIISLGVDDQYFPESELVHQSNIIRVDGGKERVDSVLNGLKVIDQKDYPWVLVHDAARPCITHQDIDNLIEQCLARDCGGILATPVRDTMKRGSVGKSITIKETVDREQLWHALTPQMYKTNELISAIEQALDQGLAITDEASAIESANLPSLLIPASTENIKITHPNDLALAEFYINKQVNK